MKMSESKQADIRELFGSAVRGVWWLVLIRGLLLIVLGAYALFNPLLSAVAFAQVAGIYLLVDGALAIYIGITGQSDSRLWSMLRGILLVLVGLFSIGNPLLMAFLKTTFLVAFIAVGMIMSGVLEIINAVRDRLQIEGEGWLLLGGALDIVLGVVLLLSPFAAGLFMLQIVGAFAVFAGVSLLFAAFRFRRFGSELKKLVKGE
jgi:uncharacterized membrane protein HdeD (DUF308 family)